MGAFLLCWLPGENNGDQNYDVFLLFVNKNGLLHGHLTGRILLARVLGSRLI